MYDGRFVTELVSGVPVVAAPDEIDMTNARELGLALLEAAADGPGTLVADMGRTQYCDSSGIHTLLAVHKHAQADGGELLLVGAKAAVLRVFTITGIDRLIPYFTSLEDALTHASTQSDGRRRAESSNKTLAEVVPFSRVGQPSGG
jgi:anti-sigma B factor antagonist